MNVSDLDRRQHLTRIKVRSVDGAGEVGAGDLTKPIWFHARYPYVQFAEKKRWGVSSLDIRCIYSTCYPGPVFLPSEHDELPPGVAFMVRYAYYPCLLSCADQQLRPSNVAPLQ
jgi:hypothetical protein